MFSLKKKASYIIYFSPRNLFFHIFFNIIYFLSVKKDDFDLTKQDVFVFSSGPNTRGGQGGNQTRPFFKNLGFKF